MITVTTSFDGAAPETVDREVTGVIEGAMGRISGVADISSRSSVGRSRVTVEFNDKTDLNVAASDARDSIGRIANQLPDNADQPRIVKADANADPVMRIGVTSKTMPMGRVHSPGREHRQRPAARRAGRRRRAESTAAASRIFRVDVLDHAGARRAAGLTVADVRDAARRPSPSTARRAR